MSTAIEPNTAHTTIVPAGPRAFFAGRCDLPPGINASYQPGSDARPIIGTKALHQFKKDAAHLLSQGYHDWAVINAIRSSRRKVALRMEIRFFFKSLWKCDIDGGIKAVQDAVFARLELNDNLVVDLHVTKDVDTEEPRAEIEVYCIIPTSSH